MTTRYYAYSPQMGRRRVPEPDTLAGTTIPLTDTMAIDWAAGRGAVNVVREDGPASKPHSITLVWQRDQKTAYDIELAISNVLAERFPNATVREIGETTRALAEIFKVQ